MAGARRPTSSPRAPNFRLIQAEAVESRTAMLADEWIPDCARHARAPSPADPVVRQRPPRWPDSRTTDLALVARRCRPKSPRSIVSSAPAARPCVARPEAPVPESWNKSAAAVTELAAVPDHSIRVLLIDESSAVSYIPWHRIQRKLVRENPLVVTFAVSRGGYARHAQYALPTAVYPEVLDDIAPAVDSVHPTFRISVPLVTPPAGMVNPADFVGALAGLSAANALRERADAIHKPATAPSSPTPTAKRPR